MAKMPVWYRALRWKSYTVSDLNTDRSLIPSHTGVYAFTLDKRSLHIGQVLYLGMTAQRRGLRGRLSVYLKDYANASSRGHKGAKFIWGERDAKSDKRIIVHFAEFGGNRQDTLLLEANLIHLLQPYFNSRDEEIYHPILDNDELFFEEEQFGV